MLKRLLQTNASGEFNRYVRKPSWFILQVMLQKVSGPTQETAVRGFY